MTIKLLGTAAAEGIPAFLSGSRVSEHARKHGGRETRTRSGALVDGHLKIDLPPDTLMQMHRDGLDARDWSCLLFTHSHDDHFAPRELQYTLAGFSECDYMPFPVFGNAEILRCLNALYPKWPMDFVETKSFQCLRHMDYAITPVQANHKLDEDSQNHLIQHGDKCMLYATDTGVWFEPTFEFLQDYRLDCLVIECTEGFHNSDYTGHLNMIECLHVLDRLREQNTLKDTTKVVTTHHSHNGNATYAELDEALGKEGIIAGYDGLEITF